MPSFGAWSGTFLVSADFVARGGRCREIGFSKAFEKWTVELSPAATFYSDNTDFFGGHHREQDPIFGVQAHITRTITPRKRR